METAIVIDTIEHSGSVRDPVEEFRCDVRALFARVTLDRVITIGQEKLVRDGFDAERCRTQAAAQEHFVAIYTLATARRGKIRQVVCRGGR